MRIADVARTLGVTRQTVYRYFPRTDALLIAVAMRSGDGFLDRLANHVRGETCPATAIVEGLAFAIEQLSQDHRVGLMLTERSPMATATSMTSDTALAFSRSMLHRYDIDWERAGFDEDGLSDLAEFCLRVLHSFLLDGGPTPRSGGDLRRYLARWIGPAAIYPQLAAAMDPIAKSSAPQRVRRLSVS